MHLFFDTVWKLHIGEIPEKPELKPHYLGNAYGERRYKCLVQEYNEAIAAIKKNALTIANPEIIPVFPKPHIKGIIIPKNFKPGEFYKWYGGYKVTDPELGEVKILEPGTHSIWVDWKGGKTTVHHSDLVAILTLPEEKKNTMENMTEEKKYKCRHCGDPINWGEYHTFEVCDTCFDENYKARTASGSVAAPKEEGLIDLLQSHRLSYTFEEDGETGLSLLDRLTPPGDNDVSRGNDEIQLLAEEIELHYSKELTFLRQQLKEREEALKDLLPIADQFLKNKVKRDQPYYKEEHGNIEAIIERARKLILK